AAGAPAAAHAVLERATPAPNGRVSEPPDRLVLRFSEPIDPAFSGATVVDALGARRAGAPEVGAGGRELVVPLSGLRPGLYTVRWQVLSLLDGHATRGIFVFGVGEAVVPPPGSGVASAASLPVLSAVGRWIATAAAMQLLGALWLRAVLRRSVVHVADAAAADAAVARLGRLATVAAVALLGGLALETTAQASLLFDRPVLRALADGSLATFVGSARPGQSALVRAALAGLLLLPPSPAGRILQVAGTGWLVLVGAVTAALGGLPALGTVHGVLVVLTSAVYGILAVLAAVVLPQVRDVRIPEMPWVPVAAAGLLLAGFTASSHAAGSGLLAMAADWVHLIASAAWLGGLGALLVVLVPAAPDDRQRLATVLVPRASRVAATALALVILTGLYAAWLHVPGVRALVETFYGRGLLLKMALVAAVVILGAVNRFWFLPRVVGGAATPGVGRRAARSATGAPLHRLVRLVAAEVGVAAAVVAAAVVIAVVPPARTVAEQAAGVATLAQPLVFAGMADDLRIALTVAPAGSPGWHRYEVAVQRTDGQPLEPDSRVLLRFLKLDEDVAPVAPPLRTGGPGRAQGDGVELAVPGWWEATVVVRRRGRPDAVMTFPLVAGRRPEDTGEPEGRRLLERAQAAMAAVSAWREEEHLTDGAGGAATTWYEVRPPDRLRLRTAGGAEVVVIGRRQYVREPGRPWIARDLTGLGPIEGVRAYLRGAQSARLGRQLPCGEETCQVVVWDAPGRTAAFAAWIGTDFRIHRLLMAAPAHYMTLRTYDLGASIRIDPPQ
ncbi:MAG: copper resistance protein CopC, partial [Armatimonadota bacterium]|nr:copper resistance protein CopC [Armatimonadota bacterium]